MKTVWVLTVLVLADGHWQDWNSYTRLEECLEVVRLISYHREDILLAKCERREIKQ